VDTPWFVLNIVTGRDFQTPTKKKSAATALNTVRPGSESYGTTRQQQVIAKTPAK
jgi:hypothetical protein